MCGGPIDECTDPANEFKWVGTGPVRCHRGTVTSIRQNAFVGEGKEPPPYAENLLWGLRTRQPE